MRPIIRGIFERYLNSEQAAFDASPRELWPVQSYSLAIRPAGSGSGTGRGREAAREGQGGRCLGEQDVADRKKRHVPPKRSVAFVRFAASRAGGQKPRGIIEGGTPGDNGGKLEKPLLLCGLTRAHRCSHPPVKPARSRPRRRYGLFRITRHTRPVR